MFLSRNGLLNSHMIPENAIEFFRAEEEKLIETIKRTNKYLLGYEQELAEIRSIINMNKVEIEKRPEGYIPDESKIKDFKKELEKIFDET